MEWINQASFAVNKAGVSFIETFQTSYPNGDKFFQLVTETANPQYAFSIFFPVFSVLNPELATKVLMTAMISDWANALLKWLLMGHRPFWWVKEFLEQAQPLRTPKILQTPATCETGPGNPSGHVMSFAAIVFILMYSCNISKQRGKIVQRNLSILVWSIYSLSILVISLSRLFVAAHFPHQCALGALIGLLLGYGIEKSAPIWLHKMTRRQLLKATAVIWMSAFGGYWLQRLLGVDPQWSVKLAFKWCVAPEYIHVSTTPIFALTRDCGTALGLALSINSMPVKLKLHKMAQGAHICLQATCVGITLWLTHIARISAPTRDARIYYVCIMLLNAALPFLLLVSVPKLTNLIIAKIFPHDKKH